jgi:hypothetical protein
LPSIGWSHRTGLTNTTYTAKRIIGNVRPAAGALHLAEHGPTYIITAYIPYKVEFMANDYNLKANHTYDFQQTENLVNWYQVVDSYFAPADEVYTRTLNISVNNYYFGGFHGARMVETP